MLGSYLYMFELCAKGNEV